METSLSAITFPCGTYGGEYDVVVIGGGTAGAFAGIAAADSGKKVLILERSYSLGGTATLAQVTPLMSNHLDRADNSYLTLRLREKMTALGAENRPEWSRGGGWFSPVMLIYVLEQMAKEAGAEIVYGADFVSVNKTGDHIDSVCINTVDGLQLVRAKTFIDATGDALVAWRAGCPCQTGDEQTGNNQPASLRFAVSGVDMPALRSYLNSIGIPVRDDDEYIELASLWSYTDRPLTELFRKGVEDGELEYNDVAYFQSFCAPCNGGVIYFNCPEAPDLLNTVHASALTDIVLTCREAAVRLHTFMKKHVGGFENSVISSFAEIPGIREGRRIEGQYVLTEKDYSNRLKISDAVAQTGYPVDVHGHVEEDYGTRPMQEGEYVEIPYRCLVPKNADNLLVAGRCISTTFIAQSAIRIQLVCRCLGEAAGIACAMACDQGVSPAGIRGEAVKEEMIKRGAVFMK